MGRTFDTLRVVPTTRTAAPPPPAPAHAPAEGPGEMSFIEIGPKREVIAASADVLAAAPRPAKSPPPVQGPHVQFRSLTPSAGSVPVLRRPRIAPELVAYHAPQGPEAARYLELFTAVREAAATKAVIDHFVLLFSALRPGVGATNVLLNLAVSAARQGRRALVLDANLRRPAAAARLGMDKAPGLAEVLAADCSLGSAIRPTDQEGLFLLSAGEPQAVLADARTLQDLLAALREQFDFVFVDGPPWDGRATVSAFAAGSDAVFLVLPGPEADAPQATALVRDLPRQGIRLAGTILTGQ